MKKGKPPILSAVETRELLDSIDLSTVIGLRDRAIIAAMAYSFVRVGAMLTMKVEVEDDYTQRKRCWVRLHEQDGKQHEMPAHPNLEDDIDAYVKVAGIEVDKQGPLFRSAKGRTGVLGENRMAQPDDWRMIRRRTKKVGIKTQVGCHSFRATGITNYLENGGTLEKAQVMANHESPRTTKLRPDQGPNHT